MTEDIATEEIAAGSVTHTDDGRDWTAWLVWNMRTRYRMRNGIWQNEPVRPQVVSVKIVKTAKKKRGKRGR